jgi:uncharacterized membrane protein
MRIGRSQRRWIGATAVAAGLVCLGVAALPTAERSLTPEVGWARLLFRPACHQIPDRCLDLGDGPLPVCARCFGLYVGGWLGLTTAFLLGRRFRPKIWWVALAALPSVVDFAIGFTGLPTLPSWPRFAVAVVPATMVGLLLADAIASVGADSSPPRTRGRIA